MTREGTRPDWVHGEPDWLRALRKDLQRIARQYGDGPCGRPTSTTGRPCRLARINYAASCDRHATAAELANRLSIIEPARQKIDAWRAGHQAACTSWEMTREFRRAAQRIAAEPNWRMRSRCGWVLLRDWQQERCAVCAATDPLVLDHDHDTALVRGWLCRDCNHLEGMCDHSAFDRYRERPPAVILGVRAVYYSSWKGWARPRASA